MIFGTPAKIEGFPRHVLYRCKGMGWCLTDSDSCDPIFIGNDCWFSTKGALRSALEPLRLTHIPAQDSAVVRMKPRSLFAQVAP